MSFLEGQRTHVQDCPLYNERHLESLTFDVEKTPLAGEVAWSSALQTLLKMREIDDDNVASKDDSESAIIGLDELRGEAVLAPGSKSILYCSLSQ